MMNKQLLLVLVNVTIYAICFQMLNPVLIEIVAQLSEGNSHYGLTKSLFSLVQTLGGLFMGPLTDKYGSKLAMLLSIGGSTLYYFTLLNADSLWILYLANIPTFFQHMFLAVQKYLADRIQKEDRAKYNGYLGLSYGMGVFIGPQLGGIIGKVAVHYTPFCATFLSFISFLSILFLLKGDSAEDIKENNKKKQNQEKQTEKVDLKSHLEIFKNPTVFIIISMKAAFAIGTGIYYTMLNVFLKDIFDFDASSRGTVLSGCGLVGVLSSAFLTPYLSKKSPKSYQKRQILTSALLIVLSGYLILLFQEQIKNIPIVTEILVEQPILKKFIILFCGLIPITLGATVFQNFQSAELTNSVSDHDTGTILSIDMALGSLYRVFTPALGGLIYDTYGYQYLCLSIAICMTISLLISYFKFQKQNKSEKQEETILEQNKKNI